LTLWAGKAGGGLHLGLREAYISVIPTLVMPGPVPGIHVLLLTVDGRNKPGHDKMGSRDSNLCALKP
jgi:hypothetical protein